MCPGAARGKARELGRRLDHAVPIGSPLREADGLLAERGREPGPARVPALSAPRDIPVDGRPWRLLLELGRDRRARPGRHLRDAWPRAGPDRREQSVGAEIEPRLVTRDT